MAFSGKTSTDFFETCRAAASLDYGWIEGSDRFKELVASLYQHMTPANIFTDKRSFRSKISWHYSLFDRGRGSCCLHAANVSATL